MKAVALDYGRARIGMAISDPDGFLARGLPTVERRKYPDSAREISRRIVEQQAQIIVCGLALSSDDTDTAMSREARAFALQVGELTGLNVEFVDESYSSVTAQRLMMSRKKRDRRDKAAIDRVAACLILDSYLQAARERPPAGA